MISTKTLRAAIWALRLERDLCTLLPTGCVIMVHHIRRFWALEDAIAELEHVLLLIPEHA